MKGWGITFALVGVLHFVLPYVGFHMLLTTIFAPYHHYAAVAFIILGVVLFVAGLIRERSAPPPNTP